MGPLININAVERVRAFFFLNTPLDLRGSNILEASDATNG